MNVKFRLKIKKIKSRIGKAIRKILLFVFNPLIDFEEKRSNEKFNRIKEYNKNMTDEELMKRYAKYIVKEMIRRNDNKTYYYICNKYTNLEDLEDGFIVYDLRTINHDCKDKYLRKWYYTSDRFNLYDDNIMELENKFNKLLKEEVEKLGCRVEYVDEREKLSSFWVKRSDYQSTMMIYLL